MESLEQREKIHSQKAEALLAEANGFVITGDTIQAASKFISNCKRAAEAVEEEFKADREKAHELWKSICDRIKRWKDIFLKARQIVDQKVVNYQAEQERLAAQARAKAEAEAREKERKEKERLAKLAENAKARGDEAKADEFNSRADAYVAPVIPDVAQPDKTIRDENGKATVTIVETWEVGEINLPVLITGIAAGKAPVECVDANPGFLKRYKKIMPTADIPGVNFKLVKSTKSY